MRCAAEEVRYEAAGVLAKFIACNHYSGKSREVLTELSGASFMASTSYQQRISFIYFIEQASAYFSRGFFKRNKLFCVLELAADKVKNVRLKLARALPKIR